MSDDRGKSRVLSEVVQSTPCPDPSISARRAAFQGDGEIAMKTTRVVVCGCAKKRGGGGKGGGRVGHLLRGFNEKSR